MVMKMRRILTNDIFSSKRGNRNSRTEIRDSDEDDFASNDTKDNLDELRKWDWIGLQWRVRHYLWFFKSVFMSNLTAGIYYK